MFNPTGEIRSNRGGNIRNSRCTHPAKIERQEGAKARAALYDKLTTQQKLSQLIPDGSNRQRIRLMDRLAKENMAVVEKAEKKAEKKK